MNKSSVEEIRKRFDQDVERFSNLETGQLTAIDSTLSLEILATAVFNIRPDASSVLDLGCGAGNFTLKLLSLIPDLNCTLVDLSQPMLDKAKERIGKVTRGSIHTIHTDFLTMDLPQNCFDCVISGAALHHLREGVQWENVFGKVYKSLRNGGCFLISDLVTQDYPALDRMMKQRYEDYLVSVLGKEGQEAVFENVEKEDTPRSVNYQLNLMKRIGFSYTEILHKNGCFAVFGGIK